MAKEQTNCQRLKNNKIKALEIANYIQDNKLLNVKSLIESNQTKLKDLVRSGDYKSAIEKLDEIKDNKLGIIWHVRDELSDGTKVLVRDARSVTDDTELLKTDADQKYGMQVLNQVRAANLLIDQDSTLDSVSKQNAKEKLKFLAIKAIDLLANDDNEFFKPSSSAILHYNAILIDTLKEARIEAPEDKMKFAKQIVAFADDHKHIVTLTAAKDSQGSSYTVAEADIMLNGLSENQRKQYELIATESQTSEVATDLVDMSWYNKMPDYKKALLKPFAADIAKGNKVIPSQMLKDLPGLRNAYQKVTAIKGSEGKFKIISENLHSGAPATKIKDGASDIVAENIKQLQSFLPEGSGVNLNILNSNSREDFIFKQLPAQQQGKVEVSAFPNNIWRFFGFGKNQTVANESLKIIDKALGEVEISAFPINRWRFFGSGRNQTVANESLKIIGKALGGNKDTKDTTQNIAKFLQEGSSWLDPNRSAKAKENLNRLDNKDLAKALKAAIDAKELLGKNNFWNTYTENINLGVVTKMNIVQQSCTLDEGSLKGLLEESKTSKLLPTFFRTLFFCKSGKDRTGLVGIASTHQAVSNYLGIDDNDKTSKENLMRLGAGGHTQEMAGIQGGTIGCHSIKTNLEFGVPANMQELNGIINQESASFNKDIPSNKSHDTVTWFNLKFEKFKESQEQGRSTVALKAEAIEEALINRGSEDNSKLSFVSDLTDYQRKSERRESQNSR